MLKGLGLTLHEMCWGLEDSKVDCMWQRRRLERVCERGFGVEG